jgi:hypothetical protein
MVGEHAAVPSLAATDVISMRALQVKRPLLMGQLLQVAMLHSSGCNLSSTACIDQGCMHRQCN